MKKKILLVEDDYCLAGLYERRLKKSGYEVMVANSVKWAKILCERFSADLALIDQGLEDGEGLELATYLKAKRPKIKTIILSNYSRCDFKEELKELKIDDYLVKLNTSPQFLVAYLEDFWI